MLVHRLKWGDVMGYRIVYGPEITCPVRKNGIGLRLRSMIASAMLVFSMLVRCFWPEGCEKLGQAVLPEAASEVQIAMESMILELSRGSRFEDAFAAFCSEVMSSDGV